MNTLDLVILLCFVPGLVKGLKKGFISQVVGIVSIILGIWLAFHFSEMICQWLSGYLPDLSPKILSVIAFVLVLTVVSILLKILGDLVSRWFKLIQLGWLNRGMGLVFAVLKSALIIGMAIILFETLNDKIKLVSTETIGQSSLYLPLKDLAFKVFPYLKALLFKQ